ncbi:Hypothetical protein PHPALM_6030 [Phytophthora palmivora]|uniref:RxLR effector protein n=1 Tax=Phytophthora palmivora TaxID=4796 RepID=A0A2P4YFV9_9STRA|nr:Hypothetical protein PHPALM_6030 [Phytophthora palmivora]
MRVRYIFLLAVALLASSNAVSATKTVGSSRVILGRSLRAHESVESNEERGLTSPDIKAMVKQLIAAGSSKIEALEITGDLKQILAKIFRKEKKVFNGFIDEGMTPEKMDNMLANPAIMNFMKEKDLSDDAINLMREEFKAHYAAANKAK